MKLASAVLLVALLGLPSVASAEDWVVWVHDLQTFEVRTWRIPAEKVWWMPADAVPGWKCHANPPYQRDSPPMAPERGLWCAAIGGDGKATGHEISIIGQCVPTSDPAYHGIAGRVMLQFKDKAWGIEFDCASQYDRNKR